MKDENLDRIMDRWVEEELRRAPEIRPAEAVYRQLDTIRIIGQPSRSRLYIVASTAAAMIAVVVVYIIFLMPPPAPAPPIPTPIGLRKGFLPGRGGSEKGPEISPRGDLSAKPKKGGRAFSQLLIQYQRPEARRIREFDLRQRPPQPFSLTAADNYRLVLGVSAYRHVYVVQLSPDLAPVMLFPNRQHSPAPNPVPAGRTLQLPGDPYWFHLGNTAGEERLLILAAEMPFRKLEELWNSYLTAGDADEQQTFRRQLVDLLQAPPAAAEIPLEVTVFFFQHHPPEDHR
ncbi:MAG: DUF4384 domain-containing protein [Acidobacteria bacterium]|nr:DUF4384 domain-containing protein [Acidobacteriota bacterium]